MRHPHRNRINIFGIRDDQSVGRIGFPGMSREVAEGEVQKTHRLCHLTVQDGFDSKMFYNGIGGMNELLEGYAKPLRRLADK